MASLARQVSATLQKKCVTQQVVIKQAPVLASKRHKTDLAAYRKGRGGRSSFNGVTATVFGATGFLGRYVVNHLGKCGTQVVIPYRGPEYDAAHLKLTGDLGQILFHPYNLRDEDSIRKAISHSNVVINLIGREWETKNYTYEDVHVTGAETIARICAEQGVEKLVHVSAMNASENVERTLFNKQSRFLLSKAKGEAAVRSQFPDAVIMRPADMWGEEDRFFFYWAYGARRHLKTMPLWKKGEQTVKQPIAVTNVAEGVVKAALDKDTDGATFECVGAKGYYLADMIDYFYDEIRWGRIPRSPIEYMPTFHVKAMLLEQMFPAIPYIVRDTLIREAVSDRLTGCPTLEDLGVQLNPFEDAARYYLQFMRRHRYYLDALGEVDHAPDPPTAEEVDRLRVEFY